MSDFVAVQLFTNYALLTIKRNPVNSMNLDLWVQLSVALASLEENEKIRALVIRSGLERPIFTAGNDIMDLYAPNTTLDRYMHFWKESNRFCSNLYRSRLLTIALIPGACPAGGCVISLCCDYRYFINLLMAESLPPIFLSV